jgi:transcriptional pleiotropic regulator of transition state genes
MIMKATGIVRKVDELGRIVLPIELRRTLDIEERDQLEIFLDGEKIVLKKHESVCLFCGSSQGLTTYRGKQICGSCVRGIGRM